MRSRQLAVTLALARLLSMGAAWSETILKESFEQQGKWKKNIRGKGTIELAPGGIEGKCLKVTTNDQALVYYTIRLDPKRVRGKRLIVRAKVKLDNVVKGPEIYSTAKIHIGVGVKGRIQHRAQRFVGTMDWRDEVLIAPIPEDADRVILDLGIQNANGAAFFDDLVVDDGVKEHRTLSIKSVANTSFRDEKANDGRGGFIDTGRMDLRDLPIADVRLGGVDFYILHPGENYGRTCIALRGEKRPGLPPKIETVIPVGQKGAHLFFLQAAAWVDPKRHDPCLVYTIRYDDGKSVDIPMREGIDIGAFEKPRDLPNWKVAWSSKQGGSVVGLGVTTWENPRPEVPINFIRLSTPGKGAVPIVAAISLDPRGE